MSLRAESNIPFIDTLFAIVIAFMVAEFKDFGLQDMFGEGFKLILFIILLKFIVLKYLFPFLILYIIYMIKLSLFWFYVKVDLALLSYYHNFKLGWDYYIGMIFFCFLYLQLISSIIVNWQAISSDPYSVFSNFIFWFMLANILGDGLPSLVFVPRKMKELFNNSCAKHASVEKHRKYYVRTVKWNGAFNIILPLSACVAFWIFAKTDLNKMTVIYRIFAFLLVTNLAQEIFLHVYRRKYLTDSVDIMERGSR
jgi:hypothetical protein